MNAIAYTLLIAASVSLQSTALSDVPNGKESSSREVSVPRFDAQATIDGFLNEPEWAQAVLLSGFYQFLPIDGLPAEDSTHVLAWYAPTGIYFGIRAFEAHGEVHATLADRDKIETDDYIQILLDTFNDRRQAFVVGVNPLGAQSDGVIRDAQQTTGSKTQRDEALPYKIDLTPDYIYQSKGRLTAYGYEVEIFIPFKSLRYQSEDVQTWGFNVVRRVQHSGFSDAWTQVNLSNVSFLSQSGELTGLKNLRRGLVLDLSPEITSVVTGATDGGNWKYDASTPELGGNVRWGVTNNLSLTATINPDFSQVEADVAKISFDPRQAVSFPEKRPFFLDGIEQFDMPNKIIYTRRLSRPVAAVKLTGKVSDFNVGVLSGADRRSTSITGDDYRYINAIRLSRDLWEQSSLGMAYTHKVDGDHTNQVASVDGRLNFAGSYSVTFQGSGSFTDTGDGTGSEFAPLWMIQGIRSGRGFGFNVRLRGIHSDFNAESGFISQTNIVSLTATPRFTIFGDEDSWFESISGSANMVGNWTYDDFTSGRDILDRKLFANLRFGFRGGWQIGLSALGKIYGYPEELYDDYFIERTSASGAVVDTVAFREPEDLKNIAYSITLITPRFRTFSANVYIYYGQTANWWEWATAEMFILDWELNWTPTEQLRVNFLFDHAQYIRPNDRSNISMRRVPRLKIEYQVNRSIFVRVVGKYDSRFTDALRDNSRTEGAILIAGSDGELSRTEESRRNDLRIDWLFSYRPTPGTVFFFGYGSSLREPDTYRFQDLDRISDGFFLKLSYLFRV